MWMRVLLAAVVTGSVLAPRPRPRPSQFSPVEVWARTVIAVEFDQDVSDHVFIQGGFTNGSLSRCKGPAELDPCSIPIQHLFPSGDTDLGMYTDWAENDDYLDFHGPELSQGYSDEIRSAGTPTRKLDGSTALGRLVFDRTASQNKTFWAVELNMDCTTSNNFFEVQVLLKSGNSKRRFATADLYGPGLTWSSDRARPSSLTRASPGSRSPVHPMRWLHDVRARQKRADPAPGFTSETSLGKPFGIQHRHDDLRRHDPLVPRTPRTQLRMKPSFAQGIRHRPMALRGPENPTCITDFPYTTSRFVGKCGHVNILKHSNGDCEIKDL